jgi:serine/threonine protein kinase
MVHKEHADPNPRIHPDGERPEGIDDPRVVECAEAYLSALQAGKSPDRQAVLERFPEIANELAECLDALEFVRRAQPEADLEASDQDELGDSPGMRRPVALGDFRIVREIGRGGMGVVYEAEQTSLGRKVALKVLPFAAVLDPRHLKRFKNEAQAAAGLHHQNIVPVHGVGCERGVHYYAMQYIEGQTLAQVIRDLRRMEGLDQPQDDAQEAATSNLADSLTWGKFDAEAAREHDADGPSSGSDDPPGDYPPGDKPDAESRGEVTAAVETARPAQAAILTERSTKSPAYFRSIARLGIQVAKAIDHAHEEGVVHRDVKPSNLILDAGGKVWVTDFGLARVEADPGLTMTGDLLGTLRYMSPEQALAKRVVVDHRTDVYSLGVTLYELLTLQPAFGENDRQELLRRIASEEPPRVRKLNKAIPADLETIVLKAMAKNPAERYDSARELADDLERFLEDKPIRARRAGLIVRFGKWARRHRALSILAASVLLLAVVSGAAYGIHRQQTLHRLGDVAKDGLADARVAMAQRRYADAQRRLAETRAELAGEPVLLARFGGELEDALREAELQLRLVRFSQLAEKARFSAAPLLSSYMHDVLGLRGELLHQRYALAKHDCHAALDVFHVLENPQWQRALGQKPFGRNELGRILRGCWGMRPGVQKPRSSSSTVQRHSDPRRVP